MMGRRSSRIGIQGVDAEMMIAEKRPLLTIPRNPPRNPLPQALLAPMG